MKWRDRLIPVLHFFYGQGLRLLNKKTVGVRILVIDDERVLLVKHTYSSGWYTIGGGVKAGETPRRAIERELWEETGITLKSAPQLFSVYHNPNERRDDYVIFYVGQPQSQAVVHSPEIAAQQWFSLQHLPDDISPATGRRIQEYFGQTKISETW